MPHHDLETQSDGSHFCRKCHQVFGPTTTVEALALRPCHMVETRTQTQFAQIRAGHLLIKAWMQEKGYTEE